VTETQKIYYDFRGKRFYQAMLTFGEYEECRAILGKDFKAMSNGMNLDKYFRKHYDNGNLEKLFQVCLKRQGGIVDRFKKYFVVDKTPAIDLMTVIEASAVMFDFFFFLKKWISYLPSYASALRSNMKQMKPERRPISQRK